VRAAELVPSDEEGLREVVLGAVQLVVDVVVRGVVPEDVVEGVPGQPQAAVVVDGLDGSEGEEEDGRTGRHPRHQEGNCTADSVQEQAFQGMVVQGSEGKRHNQSVMQRVHMLVHELVLVHPPMAEILPGIHYHHRRQELHSYYPVARLLNFLFLPSYLLRGISGDQLGCLTSRLNISREI